MSICRIAVGLAALCPLTIVRPVGAQTLPATNTRHLIQAFAGFNQPNDLGIPCTGPCFELPTGTVVVQPNHFVSSNSPGLYYAVFQTNDWAGNLSVEFTLTEAGSVVQTVTTTGTIPTAQARSAVVLSIAANIPQSSFVGPATLTATTTATPNNGGPPLTLKTYATLEVGGAGAQRIVQVFAGISTSNGASGMPCAYPECPLGQLPPGTVVVQPAQFQPTSGSCIYYSVLQANDWLGDVQGTFDLIEAGKIVYNVLFGPAPVNYELTMLGEEILPLETNYIGPATFEATTSATQRASHFTLTSYAPVVYQ
jgi:hypothetical protein